MIDLTHYFDGFSPELATTLLAMLPIAELRGAIPAGIGGWGLDWWVAAPLAIIGNMIPVFFILWWIEPVSKWLRKHFAFFDRFFEWLFERTRKKFYNKYEKWGNLALIVFVAIPLPVTGAWTGSLAAFLFGIPFKKALPLITVGVIIASIIVTLLTVGAVAIF